MLSDKPLVLYVDDELPNLQVFKALFKRKYAIEVASSGAEALKMLATLEPRVIVTDFNMPGMTGEGLLDEVSRLYPNMGRIILSGYLGEESVAQYMERGISCLFKPLDKVKVAAAIDSLL